MAFHFFKRPTDPKEIAQRFEKQKKQKGWKQAMALLEEIDSQEVLVQVYREIGGPCWSDFEAEEQEAVLSRITDQNVMAEFLLGERRCDEATKRILSHIDSQEILKDLALNASDTGMYYDSEPKKIVQAHYERSKWSFTQIEAAKRIKDYDVLAELLLQNGFCLEVFACFEDCPDRDKYYQMFADKGDFRLKSNAFACLADDVDDPARMLYYASRITDPSLDYKVERVFEKAVNTQKLADVENLLMTTEDAPTQRIFAIMIGKEKYVTRCFSDEFRVKFFQDDSRDSEARQMIGEGLLRKNPEKFMDMITEDYVNRLLDKVTSADDEGKIGALKTLRMLAEKELIPENCRERVSGLIWNEAELNHYGIIHYREDSTDIWTLGRKL